MLITSQIQAIRKANPFYAYVQNSLRFNHLKLILKELLTAAIFKWPSKTKDKSLLNELDKMKEHLIA